MKKMLSPTADSLNRAGSASRRGEIATESTQIVYNNYLDAPWRSATAWYRGKLSPKPTHHAALVLATSPGFFASSLVIGVQAFFANSFRRQQYGGGGGTGARRSSPPIPS